MSILFKKKAKFSAKNSYKKPILAKKTMFWFKKTKILSFFICFVCLQRWWCKLGLILNFSAMSKAKWRKKIQITQKLIRFTWYIVLCDLDQKLENSLILPILISRSGHILEMNLNSLSVLQTWLADLLPEVLETKNISKSDLCQGVKETCSEQSSRSSIKKFEEKENL